MGRLDEENAGERTQREAARETPCRDQKEKHAGALWVNHSLLTIHSLIEMGSSLRESASQ